MITKAACQSGVALRFPPHSKALLHQIPHPQSRDVMDLMKRRPNFLLARLTDPFRKGLQHTPLRRQPRTDDEGKTEALAIALIEIRKKTIPTPKIISQDRVGS